MNRSSLAVLAIALLPASAALPAQAWFNPGNGHFYRATYAGPYAQTQSAAQSLGGYLAKIDNAAEQAWIILNVLPTFPFLPGVGRQPLIGANDTASEGNFVWQNGAPVTYTDWRPGEPNNGGGGNQEDAVEMTSPSGLWNDLDVNEYRIGLVEIETLPTFLDPATGIRYTFTATPGNLSAARSLAAAAGGTLLCLSNAAEAAYVHSALGVWISDLGAQGVWIGLSDEQVEGVFTWDSGEPLAYTHWAAGEPNNVGNEDGVVISPGSFEWNDVATTGSRVGIIELPAPLALELTAYAGPGSIRVKTRSQSPGAVAVTIITFNTAGVGTGWFFGINPTFAEIVAEVTTGVPPFVNLLDGNGTSVFDIPSGIPAGIGLAGVSLIVDPAFVPTDWTHPATLTTI